MEKWIKLTSLIDERNTRFDGNELKKLQTSCWSEHSLQTYIIDKVFKLSESFLGRYALLQLLRTSNAKILLYHLKFREIEFRAKFASTFSHIRSKLRIFASICMKNFCRKWIKHYQMVFDHKMHWFCKRGDFNGNYDFFICPVLTYLRSFQENFRVPLCWMPIK